MGIARDIFEILDQNIEDFEDTVSKKFNGADTNASSLSRKAADGTLQFPVLISKNLNYEIACKISKAAEVNAASFTQIVLTMNPEMDISSDKGAVEYIKKFHTNIDTTDDVFSDAMRFANNDSTNESYIKARFILTNNEGIKVLKEDLKEYGIDWREDSINNIVCEKLIKDNEFKKIYNPEKLHEIMKENFELIKSEKNIVTEAKKRGDAENIVAAKKAEEKEKRKENIDNAFASGDIGYEDEDIYSVRIDDEGNYYLIKNDEGKAIFKDGESQHLTMISGSVIAELSEEYIDNQEEFEAYTKNHDKSNIARKVVQQIARGKCNFNVFPEGEDFSEDEYVKDVKIDQSKYMTDESKESLYNNRGETISVGDVWREKTAEDRAKAEEEAAKEAEEKAKEAEEKAKEAEAAQEEADKKAEEAEILKTQIEDLENENNPDNKDKIEILKNEFKQKEKEAEEAQEDADKKAEEADKAQDESDNAANDVEEIARVKQEEAEADNDPDNNKFFTNFTKNVKNIDNDSIDDEMKDAEFAIRHEDGKIEIIRYFNQSDIKSLKDNMKDGDLLISRDKEGNYRFTNKNMYTIDSSGKSLGNLSNIMKRENKKEKKDRSKVEVNQTIISRRSRDDDDDDIKEKIKKNKYANIAGGRPYDPVPGGALSKNQLEKMNDLAPILLKITVVARDTSKDGDGVGRMVSFVIGVKATVHGIESSEMIENMVEACRYHDEIFRFIRWTTGEIGFFSDFLLNLKDSRKAIGKQQSGGSPWWNRLRHMRALASFKKRLFMKNRILPNTSIAVTSNEVEFIKTTFGFDLLNPKFAEDVMNKYFLLCFIVVDEALEVVHFKYDGQKSYQSISFQGLDRQNRDKERDLRDMMKIVSQAR
jgi:hypothetical protein